MLENWCPGVSYNMWINWEFKGVSCHVFSPYTNFTYSANRNWFFLSNDKPGPQNSNILQNIKKAPQNGSIRYFQKYLIVRLSFLILSKFELGFPKALSKNDNIRGNFVHHWMMHYIKKSVLHVNYGLVYWLMLYKKCIFIILIPHTKHQHLLIINH